MGAALLGFGMYASFILLPELVETPPSAGYGFGSSVTGAGLFLVPTTLAMLVVGAQTGRLERRFGSKPPLLAGALFTAAAYGFLGFAHGQRWEIYAAALLLGTGVGLAFAALVNLIIENVGPGETGIATGMNAVTRTVGGAFGGAVVASLLEGSVGGNGFASEGGFTTAFASCAGALVLGVVVGLAIPQRRPVDAFAAHRSAICRTSPERLAEVARTARGRAEARIRALLIASILASAPHEHDGDDRDGDCTDSDDDDPEGDHDTRMVPRRVNQTPTKRARRVLASVLCAGLVPTRSDVEGSIR